MANTDRHNTGRLLVVQAGVGSVQENARMFVVPGRPREITKSEVGDQKPRTLISVVNFSAYGYTSTDTHYADNVITTERRRSSAVLY